jgi:protein SERAC1
MSEIKHLTYGIVFFGTPHQGGNGVLIGQVIESVVSSIGVTTKNNILEALKKEGQLSLEARESFRSIIEDFQYLSIVEGKPKPGFGIVVPQQSATLGLGTGRETIISVDADHSQMCKFDGDSGLFIPVKHHILQIVSQALKNGAGLEGSQPSATACMQLKRSYLRFGEMLTRK